FHPGVLGKQVPGPVEAAGGGLMTGDDECHDLVDELTLAHGGAALLVARAHEHREVVEVLLPPGAPLRDELRYDLGERAKPVRELQVARLLLRDHLEGVAAGLLGQAVQVASEDRAQNDLERELAHLVGQIHELATLRERLPALDAAVIRRRDDTREPAEDAAVEERLHHVALALPQLALARHDALAEQNPDAIQADALGVVAMIGNQHPLDVIRVVNDIGIRSACRHEHAIDVSKTGEQLEHALGTAHDGGTTLAVPAGGAPGTGHHPRLVAHLPRDACGRGGSPRRGAGSGALARAVLLAPASAVLRQVPGRAALARTDGGLAHQSVGGWGARRNDGAALRRRGDPRFLDPHRRAGAARLLPGARAGQRLARHHSRRAPRAALQVQAPRAAAGADVGPADPADGVCGFARVADHVGQVRDPDALFAHRNRHRAALLCAAGHRPALARTTAIADGAGTEAALRRGARRLVPRLSARRD